MFFTINNGILDNSSILCTPIGCCSIDDRRYWKTLGSLLATLMTQMTLYVKKKAKKKLRYEATIFDFDKIQYLKFG